MFKYLFHVRVRQVLAFLGALFILLMVLDDLEKSVAAPAPAQNTTITPLVSPVAIEPVTDMPTLQRLAFVEPVKVSQITPQVSGTIIEISEAFRKGMVLPKGKTLLKIDPLPYQITLAQAQSGLIDAEIALKNAGTRFVPGSLMIKQAEAQLELAKIRFKHAQKNLNATSVRLPFSGEINEISARLGEFISVGSSVASVLAAKDKEIKVQISSDDFALLSHELRQQTITLDSLDGQQQWLAKIIGVSQHANNLQRTLYLQVANATSPIYGQYLYAHLPIQGWHHTVSLPESALTLKGEVWWIDQHQRLSKSSLENYLINNKRVYFSAAEGVAKHALLYPSRSYTKGMQVRLNAKL
ncbi:HlyD family efflux transporter periplasmic adaptor subunit [Vibrio sp. YMD68]|uniref:efflux RND transporter periplasmic adaptor subunit n=1 Tax=Vibrio sp. YMD68 TaxID=3042300 RepID=UPI00249A90A3|nr:HlyD family efflux transporter periplasmic adaptor subunit [Vibrio sp. YMD68]WGV98346.1 HlyD family efflux transporter periplasmic adaptor subunit [Vibrio sp. YMD68]